MRNLAGIFKDAVHRYHQEATKGINWTFFNMSEGERTAFDAWLIATNNAYAYEAGTVERRFKSLMVDIATGRYKGILP